MDGAESVFGEALELGAIRLIQFLPESTPSDIRCRLVHSSWTRSEYVALSYCWGDPTPVASLRLNDQPCRIARNLHCFFQSAEITGLNRGGYFWVDCLCIDQENFDEKSEQVRQMWQVYMNAKTVISWIGGEEEHTAAAFEALNDIEEQARQLRSSGHEHSLDPEDFARPGTKAIDAVVRLTNCPYFERMWIVQEILNATDLRLMSSKHSCKLENLATFVGILEVMKDEDTDVPDVRRQAADVLFEYAILQSSDDAHGPARFNALSDAIGDTRTRKCSDVRDKVFALLGLPTLRALERPAHMTPDYTLSTEEVFMGTLSWYDTLLGQYDHQPLPTALTENVGDIAFTLGIDVTGAPFRSWLKEHVHKCASRKLDVIALQSGREIDCSGEVSQDLLRAGPIYQSLLDYNGAVDWEQFERMRRNIGMITDASDESG